MTTSQPPKLLDQLRNRARTLHYSIRTEESYADWARRYILFHDKRHPKDLGAEHIEKFLTYLAVVRNVSASTQNQAKSALLFLYKQVLGIELPWLDEIVQARVARRLPVVLTPREIRELLQYVSGTMHLVVSLLYGTGMRLLEGLRLRVKDIEFERREIIVRDGKGNKDRVTTLPENLVLPLQDQLTKAKRLHDADLAAGLGEVYLPDALARKYPKAARAWGWQYVFPATKRSVDPHSGEERRHHMQDQAIQRAIKQAARDASLTKPATPHTLHHSFAKNLLQGGYDIRTVQELLGHKDVTTTMIYTHLLNKGGKGVTSPLDIL